MAGDRSIEEKTGAASGLFAPQEAHCSDFLQLGSRYLGILPKLPIPKTICFGTLNPEIKGAV